MESKRLKDYKGFIIEKSYELSENNKINKESIIYSAYDSELNVFDCNTDLVILKRLIYSYILDKKLY